MKMKMKMMMSPPSSAALPLVLLARGAAIAVASLVLIWSLRFKHTHSSSSPPDSSLYSLLHPLLMVIGLIIISGEAILIHQWLPGSTNLKKSVHLCMQGVALSCGVFGIWTKFHGDDGVVSNFYSLHSWMGLFCIFLFAAQWMTGFLNFWHRGEARSVRARVLPWHVFMGLYTYALAVATAETGLLEKLTFMQSRQNLPKHGSESIVVNGLGLGLALLSGIVILAAVCPRDHNQPSKLAYSNAKCVSC